MKRHLACLMGMLLLTTAAFAQDHTGVNQEDSRNSFSAWVHLPRYVLGDQKAIWTSPIHTRKQDVKLWVIFAGATAALIATDRTTSRQLPNSQTQVNVATWTSRLGAAYSLLPMSAGFFLIGHKIHDAHMRETGLLSVEALGDALVVQEVTKFAFSRERPLQADGHGRFFRPPGDVWTNGEGPSFPSGHAMETWAFASVVAHEYPHPRIIPILAYGIATTVDLSRFAARRHFASDILVGAAIGWFIGDFVYSKRHNTDLSARRSVKEKILARVHLGPN